MEEQFRVFASYLALIVEGLGALLIAFGAFSAIVQLLQPRTHTHHRLYGKREVWVEFGTWLLLGLEFELAADVIRTTVSPDWKDVGQLAAIAGIRTFLNYFLEKDVEKYAERKGTDEAASPEQQAA